MTNHNRRRNGALDPPNRCGEIGNNTANATTRDGQHSVSKRRGDNFIDMRQRRGRIITGARQIIGSDISVPRQTENGQRNNKGNSAHLLRSAVNRTAAGFTSTRRPYNGHRATGGGLARL